MSCRLTVVSARPGDPRPGDREGLGGQTTLSWGRSGWRDVTPRGDQGEWVATRAPPGDSRGPSKRSFSDRGSHGPPILIQAETRGAGLGSFQCRGVQPGGVGRLTREMRRTAQPAASAGPQSVPSTSSTPGLEMPGVLEVLLLGLSHAFCDANQ